MDSRYDHLLFEPKMYQLWEKANAFSPDRASVSQTKNSSKTSKSFSIIMPPPNANDPLHVGHAMFISIEDIMIRFHRMLGDDTVWIPGTDHAGIETQFVFEKKLAKNKQSRFDFDRETLFHMIWDYVQENSGVAIDQMKKLGASADWERFMFTLDPKIITTVFATFEKLLAEKLVYRDEQLVNYCTHCGTSYSDLEVVHVERQDPLYYIKYQAATLDDETIEIATVRPELIYVDTHLAVNPSDKKHAHLIGKKVLNPMTQASMEIIGDEFVDPAFGTGIVKLTPAHDAEDFKAAKKHDIPIKTVIGFNGKLLAGPFEGLSVTKAREAAVALLGEAIVKTKTDYVHRVGTCYRCGRVLEPLLRLQFFIKVAPLVKPVLAALDKGDVTVHGAGHDKILKNWLLELHDWNISRQIVWGIRIPIWYEVAGFEDSFIVSFLDQDKKLHQGTLAEHLQNGFSLENIKQNLQQVYAHSQTVPFVMSTTDPSTSAKHYIQETDTFDTWFSSGQWPFATLQNTRPNQADFKRFYPTSVMETAYDILPFWVMRMLLLGYFATGEAPFKEVYFHGLIRDPKGQKMSKSKGNVVNPLEIVEKYGADALRLALVIRSTPGLDKSVGEADFKASRNFTNKIWNAARYVQQLASSKTNQTTNELDTTFDTKLSEIVTQVTKQLQDLKLGLAADTLYNEFWHWYCDEMIEAAKQGQLSSTRLLTGLKTFLLLLHPFVPFVTEAIWSEVKPLFPEASSNSLLITADWPIV